MRRLNEPAADTSRTMYKPAGSERISSVQRPVWLPSGTAANCWPRPRASNTRTLAGPLASTAAGKEVLTTHC